MLFSSVFAPSRRRVLIVHHDGGTRDDLASVLVRSGLNVDSARDGAEAMARVEGSPPDVVLLEAYPPAASGIDLLRAIRAVSTVPVIAMSEHSDAEKRVLALEMGADDFVSLPFSPRELLARLWALLRRSAAPIDNEALTFDTLRIDPATRQVHVAGHAVALRTKEFDLLVFLARSPRRVFTRGDLLQRVWGSRADWQNPATVTEHVSRLRRKLEVDPARPRWIVTVRSVGYRFEP